MYLSHTQKYSSPNFPPLKIALRFPSSSLFGTVILAAAAEAATQLLRTVCFLLAPRGRNLSERSRVHFPPVLSPLQPPAIKRNTHSSGEKEEDVFSPFEKIVIQVFLWNYNGLRILSRLVLLSQGRVVEDALASSPAVGLRPLDPHTRPKTDIVRSYFHSISFPPLTFLRRRLPPGRDFLNGRNFFPRKKEGGSRRSKLSLFFGLITPDVTSIQKKNPSSSSQFQNFSALARCSRRGEGKNLLAHFLLIDEFAAMFLGGIPCPL